MTTIDLIFVWFYILTGITIVVTAVGLAISAEVYGILMSALKLLIPLGVVGVVVFLWRRIRSSPFKFNINR
tara:strand:+ start:142 stop:354 length:213 start_codon:yes stop_codon:yes gene_type:complete